MLHRIWSFLLYIHILISEFAGCVSGNFLKGSEKSVSVVETDRGIYIINIFIRFNQQSFCKIYPESCKICCKICPKIFRKQFGKIFRLYAKNVGHRFKTQILPEVIIDVWGYCLDINLWILLLRITVYITYGIDIMQN